MAKRTYALRACDYCDLELPGNQLVAVTDRVISGSRKGSRSYFSTRGTVGSGSSSSTYYKVIQRKLCPECYERRAAAIRRERFMRFVGTCVVLAVIVGVIAALVARHPVTSASADMANDSATDVAVANKSSSIVENIASPAPPIAAADVSAPDNSTIPADNPPAKQADDQGERDDQSAAPAEPSTRNIRNDFANAINRVTPSALESGQPEHWEAAGREGYVVPSPPQAYGDQTCRNIYSTIVNGADQSQSAPVRWCRDSEGGDWHLAN